MNFAVMTTQENVLRCQKCWKWGQLEKRCVPYSGHPTDDLDIGSSPPKRRWRLQECQAIGAILEGD